MDLTIFDDFFEGVQVIGPNLEYIYLNDSVLKQAGRSREELLGVKMVDAFPQLEGSPILEKVQYCLESRRELTSLSGFEHDGVSDYHELRMKRIDEGVLIVSRTVSDAGVREYNQAEVNQELKRELEESQIKLFQLNTRFDEMVSEVLWERIRYEAILNNTVDAILLIDFNHMVLFANERMIDLELSIVGRRIAEGDSFEDFLVDGTAEIYYDALERARTGEVTIRKLKVDGGFNPHWVEYKMYPVKKKGEVTMAVLLATDVTDRENFVEALEVSELKFRRLVEHSVTGVYVVQNGRLVYMNPTLAKMLDVEYSDQTIDVDIARFIHPDDLEIVKGNLSRRFNGEEVSTSYESRALRADGTIFWFEAVGALSVWDGEPAVIGTLIDITDRKQKEENTLQQLRSLEELSFITSHELRHGFSQLLGLSKILQEVDEVDDELREILKSSQAVFDSMDESIEKLNAEVSIRRGEVSQTKQ